MRLVPAFLLVSILFSVAFSGSVFASDCQNLQTQSEMNQCAFSDLESETKKINKTYNDIRAKLNQSQQRQFKKVQLAWIKFKDLTCEFEASGVEGGSAHSMILADCLADKVRQRNKELDALANCQEGDLSCPAW